jgi:hypothetical protein
MLVVRLLWSPLALLLLGSCWNFGDAYTPFDVQLRVVMPDGRPAKGARISMRVAERTSPFEIGEALSSVGQTDENGGLQTRYRQTWSYVSGSRKAVPKMPATYAMRVEHPCCRTETVVVEIRGLKQQEQWYVLERVVKLKQ